jgi:hypothetical protein
MRIGPAQQDTAEGRCNERDRMIPHFEKMLYDNGPLLRRYAAAWQLTHEQCYEARPFSYL